MWVWRRLLVRCAKWRAGEMGKHREALTQMWGVWGVAQAQAVSCGSWEIMEGCVCVCVPKLGSAGSSFSRLPMKSHIWKHIGIILKLSSNIPTSLKPACMSKQASEQNRLHRCAQGPWDSPGLGARQSSPGTSWRPEGQRVKAAATLTSMFSVP